MSTTRATFGNGWSPSGGVVYIMNGFRHFGFVIIIALILSGCTSALTKDIEVKAESDPTVNLGKYKTYAWLGSAQILHDPDGQWEPPEFDADAELKFLIDGQLRNRGMTEVNRNPDLVIAFIAGIDMAVLELKEDPKEDIKMLQKTPKGALVLLFLDGRNGETVWAASAVGNVQRQELSTEDVRKRLDYVVTEMFKKLPT